MPLSYSRELGYLHGKPHYVCMPIPARVQEDLLPLLREGRESGKGRRSGYSMSNRIIRCVSQKEALANYDIQDILVVELVRGA